jgi:hypothetical protein
MPELCGKVFSVSIVKWYFQKMEDKLNFLEILESSVCLWLAFKSKSNEKSLNQCWAKSKDLLAKAICNCFTVVQCKLTDGLAWIWLSFQYFTKAILLGALHWMPFSKEWEYGLE